MRAIMSLRRYACAAVLAAAPNLASAQDRPAATTQGPPPPPQMAVGPQIQRIETASAVSKELLMAITSVRELPDGRVLVNDGTRRRLLLMDTTLTTVGVVLDSLSEIANTYGTRVGALIPFRGDTTLFVDPVSYAMVVIDPAGRIVKVRSVWRAEHISYYASTLPGNYGHPGVDAQGRIVYQVYARPAPPAVPPPAGVPYFPPEPDSAFIVGANLDTRKVDTLGVVRTPKTEMRASIMPSGGYSIMQVLNPLMSQDHWAVLPDGGIAFIRALDYRIDYLNPDGKWTSSAKLPYEWQRLTDEDKQRLADSTKNVMMRSAMTSYVMSMIRWSNTYNKPYPPNFKVPEGFVPSPGIPKDWILPEGVKLPANYIYACPPGQTPPAPPPMTAGAPPTGPAGAPAMPSCYPAPIMQTMPGMVPQPPTLRPMHVAAASDLPDYKPPFLLGATGAPRADMEGNIWIRTVPAKPIPGGFVYDIINRQGELVNRIQLPPGYTLLGFGRGKIVYLSMRDATGLHLARVRLR
jgi:hypothetical protein